MPKYKLSKEEREEKAARKEKLRELMSDLDAKKLSKRHRRLRSLGSNPNVLNQFPQMPKAFAQPMSDINSLFKEMIEEVLENGLEAELDDELGYSKYDYKNKDCSKCCFPNYIRKQLPQKCFRQKPENTLWEWLQQKDNEDKLRMCFANIISNALNSQNTSLEVVFESFQKQHC